MNLHGISSIVSRVKTSEEDDFVKRFLGNESGAALVFVCVSLPLILLLLVLVIDLDAGRLTKNRLQIAADASSLAGALELPDEAAVRREALRFSSLNYPDGLAGQPVLTAADIEIGNWDPDTRVFVLNGEPKNAVRTTTRRDSTNNNPLQSIFGLIAGIDEYDIASSAVAVNGAGGTENICAGGGIFSRDQFEISGDNRFWAYCLYGRRGLKASSENHFNDETFLATRNRNNYDESTPNYYRPLGRDAQVVSAEYDIPGPDQIPSIISDVDGGNVPGGLPFVINNTPNERGDWDITSVSPNTLYRVNGKAVFKKGNRTFENFILLADEIDLEGDITIKNAVLIAREKLKLQADNTLGDKDNKCNNGNFSVYLFSDTKELEIESNNNLYAVFASTRDELKLQSDMDAQGFYGESIKTASIQGNGRFRNCDDGLTSAFGPLSGPDTAGDLLYTLVD